MSNLKRPLGQNQAERQQEVMRDRIVPPGELPRLSGGSRMGESASTATSVNAIDSDGNTSLPFMYGVSTYGGPDYIPAPDADSLEPSQIYMKLLS